MSIILTQDRSLVFRQTFENGIRDVIQNNGVCTPSDIKFKNNNVIIDGIQAHYINYKKYFGYCDSFSIRCKVKYFKFNGGIVISGNITKGANEYLFWVTPTQILNNAKTSAGNNCSNTFNYNFSLNTWYEFVITYYNGGSKFYIDGKLINSSTFSTGKLRLDIDTVGAYHASTTTYSQYLSGEIQLIERYNKALSDQEVKLLYNKNLYSGSESKKLSLLLDFDSTRGIIEDRSGRNILTASNVEVKQIGKVKSAWFNNNNLGILIPNFTLSSNYVISIWYNVRKHPQIVNTLLGSSSPLSRIWVYQANMQTYVESQGTNFKSNDNTTFLNRWNNIIVINNALYINGGNKRTGTNKLEFNNSQVYIGSYGDNSAWRAKGFIPKVQIWSGVPQDPDKFAAQLYNSQKGDFV